MIAKKIGFITKEARERGERVGFMIVSHDGESGWLAHVNFNSPHQVSKYFVDLKFLESILPKLMQFKKDELLYIDEIGQMEMFSDNFKKLVTSYLDSDNIFVGIISKVFQDPFIDKIKKRDDIKLFEITPENRKAKYLEINKLLSSLLHG
ncbi:AAA family ATPase [Patescibacteria group bacterium]|nr:AAA family ATPase [Patescibacteria group bacterium]